MAALSSVAACGGQAETKRRSGGSANHGGSATGGSVTGGTAGGGGTAGKGGAAGTASGASGAGGSGASSGAAGEAGAGIGGDGASGGEGGEVGGSSSGGAGGEGGGSCLDVCSLHGPACCGGGLECVSVEASCVVEVLGMDVTTTYDYATLEQRVAALPQELLLSFTDADIASASAEPAPAARMEFRMTAEASARHGAALDTLYNRPFRLSCDGKELFVGVIYLEGGAAALLTPVLHVSRDPADAVILHLGADQGSWGGFSTSDEARKRRIDRAELRAAFCRRGALSVLPAR
jgi:hypothetical protein